MNRQICVVGLGYVGLPLAVEFGKKIPTNGYDINNKKIGQLNKGFDYNGEVSEAELKNAKINFTSDPSIISKSDFLIVAVPTPVDESNEPDMTLLKNAAKTVGRNLSCGSIVVFESTVYPGVTEDICVPILEKESGLKYMTDFKVGYSPERINPGDLGATI